MSHQDSVRGCIPEEIDEEIACLGGLRGISKSLPPKKVLDKIAVRHKVLSDRTRLQLLLVLHKGTLCVCVLKNLSCCPDTRLSYHLAVLKREGLINFRRDKSYLRYFLTRMGKEIAEAIQKEVSTSR